MPLTLKPRPDAYGFLYGHYIDAAGQHHRVDVLPPLPHWHGQFRLDGYAPHSTDWIIYANGEEIARARSRDDLVSLVLAIDQP